MQPTNTVRPCAATWQPATVTRTGTGAFSATIQNPTTQNPATTGYASLTVHATGGAAAVTETVVHAYRIGL